MSLESMISNMINYVKINADNKKITIDTAISVFATIRDDKFKRIFETNYLAIDFYYNTLLLEEQIVKIEDLKNVIKHLFVDNNSSFTNTQSQIVLYCMQIVMNILFQKCLEYTPNPVPSNNPAKELKYIILLIEQEDSLKINI